MPQLSNLFPSSDGAMVGDALDEIIATMPADMPFTVAEVRWQCRQCGRFLKHADVHSLDSVDPGAYYGVSTRTWADCRKCGDIDDPRLVTIRETEMTLS